MDAIIELKQVSKIFHENTPRAFRAVCDTTLAVPARQITVIQGPSGSGKTTLLNLAAGITRPSSGAIFIGGKKITGLSPRFAAQLRRETIGFIFQDFRLIRGLSLLENVMIPAFPTGLARKKMASRAVNLLKQLGIAGKARQKAEMLSGGEQQRGAIARALMNDPPIILADEPTAHLDTSMAAQFMEIMRKLKSTGKTLLFASHDPVVYASEMVDRNLEMRDGRIRTPSTASS